MTNTSVGLILAMVGLLSMIGTGLNWRIVTHPGRILNRIFGDTIARAIYMIVGIALFVLGMGQVFGLNWLGG
jgi:hypothetical protein